MVRNIGCLIFSLLLFISCQASDNDMETTSQQHPFINPLSEIYEGIQHPLDAHLLEARKIDLPEIIEERHLRVLITVNRTNFFLDGATLRGFEYSLLRKYENSLNQAFKRRELGITFDFIPVPRDRLLSDLAEGLGDIAAAGLTITPDRSKNVDFTIPYLTNISELLVTHKSIKNLKNTNDLSGLKLFVRRSSSYYESLTKLNSKFDKQGIPPVDIIEADENLETEDLLEMVNSGAIKYTVCDSHLAQLWSKVLPDIRVHDNISLRDDGKIAWAVREDSPLLKKSLNSFLRGHKQGTLLGNVLFNRYYEDTEWIKNPLDGSSIENYHKYISLIKKYSEQYDFDYRLVMALAFQESGLNHNRRSHRGAVGIMQIRPSTAADPNVGIDDIRNVENNIHAGIKYLDFLRSRYFSDEEIRPRDQVRFSLAAYNAGPARIAQARRRAEEMRLDPNRWFRNVELATLNIVGRETVQYVSNINKYYVIYKNVQEIM